MNNLEPRIRCKFCPQMFELFEDLQKHRCFRNHNQREFNQWLKKEEAKIKSFESVIEDLTQNESYESME